MAGNLQGVDMQKLESCIGNYCNKADLLAIMMNQVGQSVDNLSKVWTGQRMNTIITCWNNMNEEMYTNAKFFVDEMEVLLKEILMQYQNMENKGVAQNLSATANKAVPTQIKQKRALTDVNTVKFIQNEVISQQTNLNTTFSSIKNLLDNMIGWLDSIKSYSDSLSRLVTNYKTRATSIQTNMNKLQKTLADTVNAAINVVKTTESYNDSDVNRLSAKK